MKLAKTFPPEWGTQSPTGKRTDTPTYCPVSANSSKLSRFDQPVVLMYETFICLLSIFWPHPSIDDHCRVRLSIQNSQPHTDYINANFVPVRVWFIMPIIQSYQYCIIDIQSDQWLTLCVKGGGSERDFICTQGPLQHTIADFWRMVWEQNVRIIIMVTALRHKDMVRKTHLLHICLPRNFLFVFLFLPSWAFLHVYQCNWLDGP